MSSKFQNMLPAPRRALPIACGLVLLGWAMLPAISLAQDGADEEEESDPLFQVERIEVRVFGGLSGGEKYLELPAISNELTSDTAQDLILDFSGNPALDLGLKEAPEKDLESGLLFGAESTFFMSEAFGFFLSGSVATADAVLTGRRDATSPREEFDRSSVTTFSGRFGVLYQIGKERKLPVRPYVSLAFGGLLNSFQDTDDITALSFDIGGGATLPLTESFRARIGVGIMFYSWQTDEVALDKTMIIPQATVGIVWRHNVLSAGDDSAGS